VIEFQEKIVLEDERVRLLPISMNHLDALLPIALDHPDLLKYSPPAWGSRDHLETYITNVLDLRKRKEKYSFVIYDKRLDRFVGHTSYMSISSYDDRLEIGSTWISPETHSTGLNKHMKYLMLSYAFESLQAKRVELKTDSRNLQSRRAMEKIGANYEGCLKSHTVLQDGHRRDTVFYAILYTEWPTLKTTIFKEFSNSK